MLLKLNQQTSKSFGLGGDYIKPFNPFFLKPKTKQHETTSKNTKDCYYSKES